MTTILIGEGKLFLEVEGIDKFWALKSGLTIPFEHVSHAERATEQAKAGYHGFRVGTNIPGIITAGTFFRAGEKTFWDVHNPENAIAIHLIDEDYQQLIVEVANPDEEISKINRTVQNYRQ